MSSIYRYGRKNTFLVAISTVILFGLAIPFSPNYIVFTTLRTCLGVATAGTMVVSFVIVMESVGPRYREVAGCLFQIPFIIGESLIIEVNFFKRAEHFLGEQKYHHTQENHTLPMSYMYIYISCLMECMNRIQHRWLPFSLRMWIMQQFTPSLKDTGTLQEGSTCVVCGYQVLVALHRVDESIL